jgi:flagellar biosynthesis/type III secretory pathway protein FliH
MDNNWVIYTLLTVAYIIILVIYFIRRSKSHEAELKEFLELAQHQLETHKQQSSQKANQKVAQALAVVKKVQQAARVFEDQAQEEYQHIIDEARAEKRELIAKAKAEIAGLFKDADRELKEYQLKRYGEIEKNLVKLVVDVTEKVVEVSLSPKDHEDLIIKSLEEINKKRNQS